MKAVPVTGMGAISALGKDAGSLWEGLISGRCGIKQISSFDQSNLRNIFAGEITIDPEISEYAKRFDINNRLLLFTCLGIDQALKSRGISIDKLKDMHFGVVIGTSLGTSLTPANNIFGTGPPAEPGCLCEDLTFLSKEVRRRYNISGEVFVVSTACASGAHAIGLGKDMINYEGYDMVLCGGADSLDRVKYLGHTALNTLTKTCVQPFDLERNGTLFGEGAGFLVLENHKKDTLSPHIRAYCSGAGYSCDAYHTTTPDPKGEGAVHAMKQALFDASLAPDDIGHINLHGSGTMLNDTVEAHAIESVFGENSKKIPATSVKSAIGHTMGAAGALEAVVSIMTLANRQIPITQNVNQVDPNLNIHLIHQESSVYSGEHVMSNSFGFGGSNAALIFSRC